MAETIFHIVHSVKGGCGKTAFSLFKALELTAALTDPTPGGDKAGVLLLDADLKGSGLKVLTYAKDQTTFDNNNEIRLDEFEDRGGTKKPKNTAKNYILFRKDYRKNNLNDYLTGDCHSLQEIVTESGIVTKESGKDASDFSSMNAFNGYLDWIFCSLDFWDREKLLYRGKVQPALGAGLFRTKMKSLIEEICDRRLVSGEAQYKHVIIDMPPGYDEYSGILLDVLRSFCHNKKEYEIFYYALTTADRGHMDSMLENVEKVMPGDAEYEKFDKVFIVLSEICKDEFEGRVGSKWQDRVLKLKDKGVVLLRSVYQPEYYMFCRDDKRESFSYELSEPSRIR